MLKDLKKISAANIVKCGEFVIGKQVEDLIYEKEMARRKEEEEKQERMKARLASQALKKEQAEIKKKMKETQREESEKQKRLAHEEKIVRQRQQYIERHNRAVEMINNKDKPRHTWTAKDYSTILMAMKQKSDGRLPSTVRELSDCYDNWKDRIMGEIAMEQTDVEGTGSTVESLTAVEFSTHESQDSNDSTLHSQILL